MMAFFKYSLLAFFTLGLSTPSLSQEPEDTSKEAEAVVEAPKPAVRLSGTTPRLQTPANERDSMTLLTQGIDPEHVQWLTTTHGPYAAIWYQDQSGYPKGAVLMVHDQGESPYWPKTTAPLHESLPASGWSTLAIALPPPKPKAIPERTTPAKVVVVRSTTNDDRDASKTDSETSTDTTIKDKTKTQDPGTSKNQVVPVETIRRSVVKPIADDAEQIALDRLKSAINFLHDRGQFNIVLVGYGVGAIRANALLKTLSPTKAPPAGDNPTFRGFVIINGDNYLPDRQEQTQWFENDEMPVLDIYLRNNERFKQAAHTRKVAANRNKIQVYKTLGLPEMIPSNSGENRLSRRVRGFLKKYAEGVEVDNAQIRRYQ